MQGPNFSEQEEEAKGGKTLKACAGPVCPPRSAQSLGKRLLLHSLSHLGHLHHCPIQDWVRTWPQFLE